ncbi:L-tryptophan--pyruvate aminotransferase 1-like [Punica granatum]|uniref:L-tryptophan--pyruvate aminotransferase 1-like n=2 Tax=Punica granatum TaxID=22663 RepID=A0A6P8E534_PUNGR|nr:L-tryptophan--pyruvate aminotransferase 1-like [Punica granatum]
MGGTENTTTRVGKANFGVSKCTRPAGAGLSPDSPVNLDQGDPTMFEEYWRKNKESCDVVIGGSELMSYFSNPHIMCWYLLPELEDSIRRLHSLVGNVSTEGRHIIVGNGSTQLLQATLYALSADSPQPVSVVCAAPYYSCYPELADLLKSGLYKWEGDAYDFDKEGPYIELVTSPNNPDGSIRGPVVNRGDGKVVYDLAYYWPQYTAITHQLDHDLMLFTFSKSTGHAGSRIGWAIVKDEKVARKMLKFMEVMSIGVSKEAQFRAAKILGAICDGYEGFRPIDTENFFEYSKRLMIERWERLREVVNQSEIFSLPKFSQEYCLFSSEFTETHPSFAWLKCKEELKDAQSVLRGQKILARSGTKFGVDPTFARVSMVSREDVFNAFLERLSAPKGAVSNGNQA